MNENTSGSTKTSGRRILSSPKHKWVHYTQVRSLRETEKVVLPVTPGAKQPTHQRHKLTRKNQNKQNYIVKR